MGRESTFSMGRIRKSFAAKDIQFDWRQQAARNCGCGQPVRRCVMDLQKTVKKIREHRKLPVLMPNGTFMQWWRPVLFVIVLYAAVMTPVELCFWWNPPAFMRAIGVCIDLFFIFDMLLQFRVAFVFCGRIEARSKKIAQHYAMTWLPLDLMTNIPFDWLLGSGGKQRKLGKLLKIPKVLRFVKFLRVIKDKAQYVDVLSTLSIIFMLAHLSSCFWAWRLFPDCEEANQVCPDVGSIYIEGLLISIATIAGSDAWSALRGVPGTPGASKMLSKRPKDWSLGPVEMLFICCQHLSALGLVGSLIANITWSVQDYTEEGRRNARLLRRRKREMNETAIPHHLQTVVESTYERFFLCGGERDGILRDPALSNDMQRTLAMHIYGPALRRVSILKNIDEITLRCLAQRMSIKYYSPGDLLVTAGELGSGLYFLHSGSVMVEDRDGNSLFTVLHPGEFFGEICFLQPGTRRNASIRALEFCRAMEVTPDMFIELNLNDALDKIRVQAQDMRQDYVRKASLAQKASSEAVGGRISLRSNNDRATSGRRNTAPAISPEVVANAMRLVESASPPPEGPVAAEAPGSISDWGRNDLFTAPRQNARGHLSQASKTTVGSLGLFTNPRSSGGFASVLPSVDSDSDPEIVPESVSEKAGPTDDTKVTDYDPEDEASS